MILPARLLLVQESSPLSVRRARTQERTSQTDGKIRRLALGTHSSGLVINSGS